MNEHYESLDSTFNMDFKDEESTEKSIKSVEKIANSAKELQKEINDQRYNLEDRQYLIDQLKDLYDVQKFALECLGDTLKVGAPPRAFECFATLSNSLSETLKTIMMTNKITTDYKVQENKEDRLKAKANGPTTVNNNLMISSSELLKLLNNAKNNSELNNIVPKFNLEEAK